MLYLGRAIDDSHFWVVEENDGALVETAWRIDPTPDGYRLRHDTDQVLTQQANALGAFNSAEDAVSALRTMR